MPDGDGVALRANALPRLCACPILPFVAMAIGGLLQPLFNPEMYTSFTGRKVEQVSVPWNITYLYHRMGGPAWSGLNGIRARCLARLMAVDIARWCLAQTPVLRRDSIFHLSVMYLRKRSVSL